MSGFSQASEDSGTRICSKGRPGLRDYQAAGALYLPEDSRFETLLNLSEEADIGKAINQAMGGIEVYNPDLQGVLPRDYSRIPDHILAELLRLLRTLPKANRGWTAFGLIYEYFLGNFAFAEGQKGGEFLYAHLDRAAHRRDSRTVPRQDLRPCMRLRRHVRPVRPLRGAPPSRSWRRVVDLRPREDRRHRQARQDEPRRPRPRRRYPGRQHLLRGPPRLGRQVRLRPWPNPPFQRRQDRQGPKLEGRPSISRSAFRGPTTANYIWIQTFYSALNANGRAGFVMANSASDARGTELEIRRKLIEERSVDVVVAAGTNMFYTVTLPVTLWFLDRGKGRTERADQVLFIDARRIYNPIDRAHRDWTPQQIEFLANIVRLWRGEKPEFHADGEELLWAAGIQDAYEDVPGLCGVATLDDIRGEGWSLNPGRYITLDPSSLDSGDMTHLPLLAAQILRPNRSVLTNLNPKCLVCSGRF